jgi:ribA/ribD-fused uncharacterized protein
MMSNKVLSRLIYFCFILSFSSLLAKDSALYDQDYKKQLKEIQKEEKKLLQKKRETFKDYQESSKVSHQKNKLSRWADKDGFIWFDDKDHKYTYFLTNDYPCSINISNAKFSCAESAFQAHKFYQRPELFERFKKMNGSDAWNLSQKLSYQQRQDWYQVRETAMLNILKVKFQQNPELADLLIATGDAYLVEHTKKDAFWADGKDGRGKNRLGHLLMQVRGELGGVGVVSKPARYRKFVD